MKRIFIVSCFIIVSVKEQSCINDDVERTPKTQKQQVSADVLID
ncbi:hypothetical protein [Flavobacterium praedii]|nr:hypothetical protein [Flavobacterium praedii]